MTDKIVVLRVLEGLQNYLACWEAMKQFTDSRDDETPDEIWMLEHESVLTQGQNGKPEHILQTRHIPIIKTDRGGQVTYHGPGQLILYTLVNLKRKKWTIREFVTRLEKSTIALLADYSILGCAKREAPGIYVDDKKIGSLGLRIRHGCAYHGLALNVQMDLTPFSDINPCGFHELKMTQLSALTAIENINKVGGKWVSHLIKNLGYTHITS